MNRAIFYVSRMISSQKEKDFREDVSIMCNLSQKIKETGIEMGKREMIITST